MFISLDSIGSDELYDLSHIRGLNITFTIDLSEVACCYLGLLDALHLNIKRCVFHKKDYFFKLIYLSIYVSIVL